MLGKRLLLAGSVAGAVAMTALACGGSDTITTSGGDDGGGSETGAPPDGAAGDDGSTPRDAAGDSGDITDGGSNFDPDAGDDGGLPDGGRCNGVDNTATAIVSTCSSKPPGFTGGALVAGTYHLIAVTDLGTPGFCSAQFLPTGFKETLVLTVAGTTATAETVTAAGAGAVAGRHATSTLTTTIANTTPMSGQQTCPTAGVTGPVPYSSSIDAAGAQTLAMALPYGKGVAVYTFQKQP